MTRRRLSRSWSALEDLWNLQPMVAARYATSSVQSHPRPRHARGNSKLLKTPYFGNYKTLPRQDHIFLCGWTLRPLHCFRMYRLVFFVAFLFAGLSSSYAQWNIEEAPTTADLRGIHGSDGARFLLGHSLYSPIDLLWDIDFPNLAETPHMIFNSRLVDCDLSHRWCVRQPKV